MKKETKVKFVSDVEMDGDAVRVRKPFRVEQENCRRYIRLEISSPMSVRRIKDIFGNFWPTEQDFHIDGMILNISAGGVLVEVDQPLNEGDIVAMRFRLQDVEDLDHVLGIVKRTDQDEDACLAGIEFVGREFLNDHLSESEIGLLDDKFDDFQRCVQQALSKYLYTEK